jgi:pentachlorophenol monooxygenase
MGSDLRDLSEAIRREAQLLINYRDSAIVLDDGAQLASIAAGDRAPDARGLVRDTVSAPVRLFSVLDRRKHTCILYAGAAIGQDWLLELEGIAEAAMEAAHGQLDVMLVASSGANVTDTALPLLLDSTGEFASAYAAVGTAAFVLRPDGYLGYRADVADASALKAFLSRTFR